MAYRTKWMDPDFRREPKTARYCVLCQRDLKEGQPHRSVKWELDVYAAILPEDYAVAESEIRARRSHREPIESGLVGMDCARKLGIEWTTT